MIASVCPRAGGRWPRRDSHDPVADSASQTVPYVRVRGRAVWPRQCALAAQLGDAASAAAAAAAGPVTPVPAAAAADSGNLPCFLPAYRAPGRPFRLPSESVLCRASPADRPPAGPGGRWVYYCRDSY